MTRTLILKRGLPGSGKSFGAKEEVGHDGQIFSTDDFWSRERPFNRAQLQEAHAWNQQCVDSAMLQQCPVIIVDNTNVSLFEMRPYVEMAERHGYAIRISESKAPWRWNIEQLVRRNHHGVGWKDIALMAARWEFLSGDMAVDLQRIKTASSPYTSEGRKNNALQSIGRSVETLCELSPPEIGHFVKGCTIVFVSDPTTIDLLNQTLVSLLDRFPPARLAYHLLVTQPPNMQKEM
jgi:predicted kinase